MLLLISLKTYNINVFFSENYFYLFFNNIIFLGPKWKKDRRLMSPLFLKRNIMQYFPVILKHTKILIKILEKNLDGPTFNIEHYIRRASTDFVNGEFDD